jgi:hypothetical protein
VRGVADPFGSTVGERLWRRLAGVAAAVVPVAAGFALWTAEVLPWVLLAVVVVYVLGVPTSWLLTRRGGAPVVRHAVAAVVIAVSVAGILSLPTDAPLGWWMLFASVAVATGVPVAVLAAWAGTALPSRWVRPVAVLGLVVTAVVLPLGTWLDRRPPAPHDYVAVHEPGAVRAQFAGAYELAQSIAERFERRAAAGESRTAHATWVAVGGELSAGALDSVASSQHLTPDEELPTLAGSGQPVRLITTLFDGDPARGCVVLTSDAARAEPRACADLDLTG